MLPLLYLDHDAIILSSVDFCPSSHDHGSRATPRDFFVSRVAEP